MDKANFSLEGRDYVVLPREEFERLTSRARASVTSRSTSGVIGGSVPAVGYARASLARKITQGRTAAGLTQRELAQRAGISFEHLCRVESGKHTPTISTINSIDRALRAASTSKPSKQARRAGAARSKR